MAKKLINDIVSEGLIGVSPTTPVRDAIQIMKSKRISCIPVLDDGRPIGIFTERNIVWFAAQKGPDFETCEIRYMMSSPVITAHDTLDIYEAYALFSKHRIRHLVVIDGQGRATGVVTQSNIVENLGYEYFVEVKRISHIMTKNLYVVRPDDTVQEILSNLAGKSVSCAIVAEDASPVGIVTERDMARFLVENRDFSKLRVRKPKFGGPIRTALRNQRSTDV